MSNPATEQKLIELLRKARERLDSVVDCGAGGGRVCSVCLKRATQVRNEIDKVLPWPTPR